jgi:MFS transporter, DHA1 family, tetracycline resistance protein
VLLVGLFGAAASYLMFGLAGSLATLFLARGAQRDHGRQRGGGAGVHRGRDGAGDRARGMGMIGAAFGLGFIFGPAIGGLLAQFGPAAPFLGAAALAAANGVLAIFRLPESLPAARRAAAAPGRRAGLRGRLASLLVSRRTDPTDCGALYLVFFLVTLAFAAMEATFSSGRTAAGRSRRRGGLLLRVPRGRSR